MRRLGFVLVLLAAALGPAPRVSASPKGKVIPLLDLIPSFQNTGVGHVLRNRTEHMVGLYVGGKVFRGLLAPAPSKIGFDVDGQFESITIKVGVIDNTKGPVTFRVRAGDRTLVATPPLFPGDAPLSLDVPLKGVLLLELDAEGPVGGGAAWLEGYLHAVPGADLSRFLATDKPFSPKDYPVAFRRRVNHAIDAGVAFLKTRQRADGSWPGLPQYPQGPTALSVLAVIKGGTKPDDPSVKKAFAYLRSQPLTRTYGVALLLMAIEARYFPGGADEKNAYIERPRIARKIIPDDDYHWIRTAADWIVEHQGKGFTPVWRYPRGIYDLSNTQYALFGLSSANRCGVPTSKVWFPVLRFLLGAQEKKGPQVMVSHYEEREGSIWRRYESAQARGFGYVLRSPAYGSMTSAGLCSLVLCEQALARNLRFQQSYKTQTRDAIRDALAWLEEYYDVQENPLRGKTWWTYYLYNLERSGVLLDNRYLGTRDWYQEGAEELMKIQRKNGAFGSVFDTDFAILFLKRATVPAITNPLK